MWSVSLPGGVDDESSPTASIRRFATEAQSLLNGAEGETPLTTPEILGSVRTESVWQSYLSYFIDPGCPHGFDSDFFETFIDVCVSAGAVNRDSLPDSPQPTVLCEVSTEKRRPDVLLYEPNDWFLLLELKVDSPEGDAQTEDYATADTIGPIDVAEYPEENRHYGFIAPEVPRTIADTFRGIRWEDIATAFIEVRSELSSSDYPQRSIVQLDDFIATLRTTMPEVDNNTEQLAQLYFNYSDEIKAAEQAVETLVTDVLQYEWTEVLTTGKSQPNFWDDSWFIRSQGKSYGQFARDTWETEGGLNVHFEHHPDKSSLKDGELEFRLDIEAPRSAREDGTDPRQPFRDRFVQLIDGDEHTLPGDAVVDDGGGELDGYHKLVTTVYTFEPGSPEAYYEALAQASDDHHSLVPIVDALFEEHSTATSEQVE